MEASPRVFDSINVIAGESHLLIHSLTRSLVHSLTYAMLVRFSEIVVLQQAVGVARPKERKKEETKGERESEWEGGRKEKDGELARNPTRSYMDAAGS